MMSVTTTNRQRLLATVFTGLKKQIDADEPPARPVLEQLIYALLREGATRKQADRAFHILQKEYFDWNEVRVSSAHEVAVSLDGLPQAVSKAQRVIDLLQEVFESTFSYDLDSLQKKPLKQAAKQLERFQATNDFTVSWAVQTSLGGHAIPLDTPTLRTIRRLGLVEEGTRDPDSIRASLEHQVPKARGPIFFEILSQVAHDYCHEENPKCSACPLKADCPTGTARLAEKGRARPKSR